MLCQEKREKYITSNILDDVIETTKLIAAASWEDIQNAAAFFETRVDCILFLSQRDVPQYSQAITEEGLVMPLKYSRISFSKMER